MQEDGATKPYPLLKEIIEKRLDVALDIGISEYEFWNMTLLELERAIESYKRRQKRQAQERANFDYALADLIGRSISRLYSSSARIPAKEEYYTGIFAERSEARAANNLELSALRFRQFAQAHNNRYKGAQEN